MVKTLLEHIKVEIPTTCGGTLGGEYAIISLHRPDKLNAITIQTLEEIVFALNSMELDERIKCVMIRGTKNYTKKPSFSTGADLSSPFSPEIKPNIPIHMSHAMYLFHKRFNIIEQFPKPLIAAVDGYALGGGCELTLVCDIIMASIRSTFGFSEILRGIFPAGGGTQRLVQNIGLARSVRMLYFGERYTASEMFKWGYIHFLIKNHQFEEKIHAFMERISALPINTLFIIKKCLKFGTQIPFLIGTQLEQLGFGLNSTSSHDNREKK
ncbi:MAG: 3-hydroxypropionyl-coenzyme A dehydratase [Promethearchaeota archaeon]|nr:MAG: 3-hydroxypropionyl-coenzyme A dehydratase [Candidatus Lokiarchaeota archaeon]